MTPSGLCRKLTALPAEAMRRYVAREYLSTAAPSEVITVLEAIINAAIAGRQGPRRAMLALAEALDELPYEKMCELYASARERHAPLVAALFKRTPSSEKTEPLRCPADDRKTLGHRKMHARTAARSEIPRILAGNEVEVLRELLLNPRLIERDVVQLAARRPTVGSLAKEILGSVRFRSSYAVRRAMVLNPETPFSVAIRLLLCLKTNDLIEVERLAGLAEPVRQAAGFAISKRRPGV